MPRKPEPRGKIGLFYYELGHGTNNAINLERNLKELQKIAPYLLKTHGLTEQDIIAIKKVYVKLGKLEDWLMIRTGKQPVIAEDIK
jgi:hypothetical protein